MLYDNECESLVKARIFSGKTKTLDLIISSNLEKRAYLMEMGLYICDVAMKVKPTFQPPPMTRK